MRDVKTRLPTLFREHFDKKLSMEQDGDGTDQNIIRARMQDTDIIPIVPSASNCSRNRLPTFRPIASGQDMREP